MFLLAVASACKHGPGSSEFSQGPRNGFLQLRSSSPEVRRLGLFPGGGWGSPSEQQENGVCWELASLGSE